MRIAARSSRADHPGLPHEQEALDHAASWRRHRSGLIDDLVTESYLLVVEGLPNQQRPVDPETFRRAPPRS